MKYANMGVFAVSEYIKWENIIDKIERIEKGDVIYLVSDVTKLALKALQNKDVYDGNILLDKLIERVGPEGTILVPTFNWDFCSGKGFDYNKSPSQTGALGNVARKRKDFKRTKHPIYSFAVWGKGQEELCAMENKDAWGEGTPFSYMQHKAGKGLILGLENTRGLTSKLHNEQVFGVPYRYVKDFTAPYTDENGATEERTYSMNVRDYDMDPQYVEPQTVFSEVLRALNVLKTQEINGEPVSTVLLHELAQVEEVEIKCNKCRNMYTYKGQDE